MHVLVRDLRAKVASQLLFSSSCICGRICILYLQFTLTLKNAIFTTILLPVCQGFSASGKLHIGDLGKLHYSYSPTLDNTNGQTLQRLSLKAGKEFDDCGDGVCPLPSYEVFTNHYGESDYADKWAEAAFLGLPVVLGERVFDFSQLGIEGRSGELLRICMSI
jgi:hypothetical protein